MLLLLSAPRLRSNGIVSGCLEAVVCVLQTLLHLLAAFWGGETFSHCE